ncbi:MAG: carboxymuconolactone decarboxylase family protein [Acidimicrobiia bacterium]
MGHYHDLQRALSASGRELRGHIPGVYEGYSQMSRSALEDGALPGRVKELMALAIAVVEECDGCIAAHARRAARRGSSPQEVAEALGVAILMSGGPATVYGPRAWDAFQEFSQ